MKAIFLDIDGVVAPYDVHHGLQYDKDKIRLVSGLAKKIKADIILNSSRQYGSLKETLATLPESLSKIIKDQTPLSPLGDKGKAVDLFLKEHPEYDSFIIIDDEPYEYSEEQKPHVFKTNTYKGITEETVNNILTALRQRTYKNQ